MKNIKKLQVVQFDSIEELKSFVEILGHAEFYNDWEGEYFPIRIDDEQDKVVIGSDAWEVVNESQLSNIYGFITIIEN